MMGLMTLAWHKNGHSVVAYITLRISVMSIGRCTMSKAMETVVYTA
jgi:hypothetical protein